MMFGCLLMKHSSQEPHSPKEETATSTEVHFSVTWQGQCQGYSRDVWSPREGLPNPDIYTSVLHWESLKLTETSVSSFPWQGLAMAFWSPTSVISFRSY